MNEDRGETFDHSQLEYIVLEYTIPYPLDLSDSIKGEEGNEGYIVVIGNVPALIKTERVPNPTPSVPGVEFAPHNKTRNDRYGLLSKTKIQVWFNQLSWESGEVDIQFARVLSRHFFNESLKYLNKLIYDYRRVTREYWASHIWSKDVIGYMYYLKLKDGRIEPCLAGNHNPVEFFDKNPSITREQDSRLRALLESNSIYLFDDLFLSVYDNYDRGHYNTALIQCAIMFEHFVYSNLNKYLSKTKIDKIKKKEKCECMVGIYEVCTRGLKEVFNFDFGSSKEFDNLKDNVIGPRNKIVHGERIEPISPEECNTAMKTTIEAIKYLNDGLFLRLKSGSSEKGPSGS